jgi:cyclase
MRRLYLLLVAALLPAAPVFAQIDLSGEYESMFHEDQPERVPGPPLGDYLGLPISDAGRAYAEAWDASRMTLKEHQCMVHVSPYIFRGPGPVRMWEEKDPETQRVVAIKIYHGTYQQTRTIWMDGRPHPPEFALHTWMGFSTGTWEGDILTVYTTHIKQGWIRRNGLPESDRATMVEHFIKHGTSLTRMGVITDPIYLTEPLVKTENFVQNPKLQVNWIWPCEPVEEVVTREKGAVPHYLPGTNAFLKEFQDKVHVPEIAQRGGAETMYPDFRKRLAGGATAVSPARAPAAPPIPNPSNEIQVMPVRDNIYALMGPGGNVTVQVGKQGILLVDTMSAESAERVLAALGNLSKGGLRYIINTQAGADHAGGNAALRKTGRMVFAGPGAGALTDAAEGAAVIAHGDVLKRMSAPTGKQSPMPPAAWPTDTFYGDEYELYFNGESVQVLHQPAANTDGNSMVYFRRSDVISTGDLFVMNSFPVIEVEKGGSLQGVIDGLNRILDIAIPEFNEEGGTLIVPGHGRLCDEADVAEYRDMVTIIRDRIQAMLKKGMSLDQIKAAHPAFEYEPLYGSADQFIEAAYKSLNSPPKLGGVASRTKRRRGGSHGNHPASPKRRNHEEGTVTHSLARVHDPRGIHKSADQSSGRADERAGKEEPGYGDDLVA